MESAMSDASPLAGQRPVWLDDKTESIMDRAIAREQSLSRMLMTYIVTGLVFMLLPGTFLGVWNLIRYGNVFYRYRVAQFVEYCIRDHREGQYTIERAKDFPAISRWIE